MEWYYSRAYNKGILEGKKKFVHYFVNSHRKFLDLKHAFQGCFYTTDLFGVFAEYSTNFLIFFLEVE